jgi:signal transduction histidine kinase
MSHFRHFRRYARAALMPILLVGLAVLTLREPVVSWLSGEEQYDQDALKEWLREAKVNQTLPELVGEYLQMEARLRALRPGDEYYRLKTNLPPKREEIEVHLDALANPPTKVFRDRLPLFPVVYRMTVRFAGGLKPIVWDSERPRQQGQYAELIGVPLKEGEAWVDLQYQLRVYAHQQFNKRQAVARWLRLSGLAVVLTTAALLWIYLAQRREQERERRLQTLQQEAERRREEAERTALELKSQLFANIGIMAGSYAHNIKNLLVRPNDLLGRCLEGDGLPAEKNQMLHEVRQTLGTVTERLQQILQTVRRDPSKSERVRIDLNELAADLQRTWAEMGREKWKLGLALELAPGPLWIEGDRSHLQQAAENLLFNARDATFEMRNHLREQARQAGGPEGGAAADAARRRAIIAAAAWKGEVTLRTRREGEKAVLEVQDNGIGMSEEVKQRCTETHFSTKRDNALFAGLSAGMGLGLSFVVVILEHHQAKLEIESEPLRGTTFRVGFPLAAGEGVAETSGNGEHGEKETGQDAVGREASQPG